MILHIVIGGCLWPGGVVGVWTTVKLLQWDFQLGQVFFFFSKSKIHQSSRGGTANFLSGGATLVVSCSSLYGLFSLSTSILLYFCHGMGWWRLSALQTLSGISIMTSMTSDPSTGGSDRRRVFVCSKNMFKYRSKHSFKGCAFDVWYKVGSFVRRSFSQWSL